MKNLFTHQVVKIGQVDDDAASGALAKVVPITVVEIVVVVLGVVFVVLLLLRFVIVAINITLPAIKLDERAVGRTRALVAKSRSLFFSGNRLRPEIMGACSNLH